MVVIQTQLNRMTFITVITANTFAENTIDIHLEDGFFTGNFTGNLTGNVNGATLVESDVLYATTSVLTDNIFPKTPSANVNVNAHLNVIGNVYADVMNTESLEVNTIISKTGRIAIGLHPTVTYTNGIGIGKNVYVTGNGAVAIGSGLSVSTSANASGSYSIAIGKTAKSYSSNSIAFGTNIIANQPGGFFVKHRGPGAYTINTAGFISGTNELVEVTSSRRFKESIRDLEEVGDIFDKLRPVRYRAKPGHGDERDHIGLIAEEVEEIYPEFVTYNTEGEVTGITFDRMIAVVIKELKSLRIREKERDAREADRDILIKILQDKINQLSV